VALRRHFVREYSYTKGRKLRITGCRKVATEEKTDTQNKKSAIETKKADTNKREISDEGMGKHTVGTSGSVNWAGTTAQTNQATA
jgi:hypothetical protein